MPICSLCGKEVNDDDHLPVTEEWLRIAGAREIELGTTTRFDSGGTAKAERVWKLSLGPMDWHNGEAILHGGYGTPVEGYRLNTRGDVRRLLLALGVDVKPV